MSDFSAAVALPVPDLDRTTCKTLQIGEDASSSSSSSSSSVEVKIRHSAKDYFATNLPLTGYGVWQSGHNLTDYCETHLARFTQDKEILELGSGVGLCGISLAVMLKGSASSSHVVLTDGEHDLLPHLQRNCVENGVWDDGTASIHPLWWGDDIQIEAIQQKHAHGFDWILGADLLYSTAQLRVAVRPLMTTVARLLSVHADARFVLAATRRNYDMDAVLDAAEQVGLCYEVDPDTIYDMFDNNICEQSVFWRDSIYVFRRVREGEAGVPAAVVPGDNDAADTDTDTQRETVGE